MRHLLNIDDRSAITVPMTFVIREQAGASMAMTSATWSDWAMQRSIIPATNRTVIR